MWNHAGPPCFDVLCVVMVALVPLSAAPRAELQASVLGSDTPVAVGSVRFAVVVVVVVVVAVVFVVAVAVVFAPLPLPSLPSPRGPVRPATRGGLVRPAARAPFSPPPPYMLYMCMYWASSILVAARVVVWVLGILGIATNSKESQRFLGTPRSCNVCFGIAANS